VLGFFLYATIFAAAGSLVSRQEEAQSVLTPVTLVLAVGFLVGLNLMLQGPTGRATTVLSLIPLVSPVLMPSRIAEGWQIGLSIVLTLAIVTLFTWLGAKVYQNAVLRTGSRVRLRDALRTS
jgi:ABC-2 type transport system permease protein